MRAIILAAGFGKRMMPFTANTHKCLLSIAGRPVLSHIVDALTENNIVDLTIVTGYRANDLHDFMRKHYPGHNIQWVHNEQYETTNNIYSLSLALEQMVADDAILIECDLIFDPSIIAKLIKCEHDATALVSAYEPGMDGTVVSLSGDVIVGIHPPHLQGEDFSFANKFKTLNIYKFSRKFIDESLQMLTSFYARSINNNCYYELVLGVMIYMQTNSINASIVDTALWSEVDDPIDMQSAEFKFNTEGRLKLLDTAFGACWNYSIEDFCYVTNAYFPPDGMLSMLRHHLPFLLKSFCSSQESLDRKLSYFLECDESKIVSLNGSCQSFPWLRDYFVGKRMLLPKPTFGEYARMFPHADTYIDQVGVDTAQLSQDLLKTDVVVLVNPNNPTGSIVQTAFIENLIQKHVDKFFIVDESFIDFSDQPSIIDFLKRNKDCKNVLVIKSLGKALGVPGLRTGFVFSNNENMLKNLRQTLPIWNMNSIAEYFLELLLKNRKNLLDSFDLVKKSRLLMQQDLMSVPCIEQIYPSQGNFLLVKIRPSFSPSQGIAQSLMQKNIYVKDATSKFNTGEEFLRLAVRKTESNEILLSALKQFEVCARKSIPAHIDVG